MKLPDKAVRHAKGTRIYEYRFQFRRQSFVGTTGETDKRKAWAVASWDLRDEIELRARAGDFGKAAPNALRRDTDGRNWR